MWRSVLEGRPLRLGNPSLAFYALLRALRPDTIFDVGSKDGTNSKRFRRLCPGAAITAFEANPANVAGMRVDCTLRRLGIEISGRAVSNGVGQRRLFVPHHSGDDDPMAGAASLSGLPLGKSGRVVEVEATTLDRHVAECGLHHGVAALWIDVEGHGWEVLDGAHETLARTDFLQIEVEDQAVWSGERLFPEINAHLRGAGFSIFCRPRAVGPQYNIVYAKTAALAAAPLHVRAQFAATLGVLRALYPAHMLLRSLRRWAARRCRPV